MKKIRSRILSAVAALLTASVLCVPVFAETESPFAGWDAPAAAAEETFETTVSVSLTPEELAAMPDSDALFEGYVNKVFYPRKELYLSTTRGRAQLDSKTAELYDMLKPMIVQTANGENSSGSTKFELNFENASSDDYLDFFDNYDVYKLIRALLADCPYEMYWYDKSSSTPIASNFDLSYSSSAKKMKLTVMMVVGKKYRAADADYYTIDNSKAGAAKAAAAKADAIAAANASVSDQGQQVINFCNAICDMVYYNHDAAGDDNYSTNVGTDPWQMIYVFDGDDSTNVVCEGYAKALKYLCDKNGIECYTVSGYMAGGDHMWNIVVLGGKNYLVDVTNCDAGAPGHLDSYGYPDKLCLKGVNSPTGSGFTVLGTSYVYGAVTLQFMSGTGKLLLSQEDYVPGSAPAPDPDPTPDPTKPALVPVAPPDDSCITIYRVFLPVTGEHLYTTDFHEAAVLSTEHGWDYEGVAWFAPKNGKPIYRLYNPHNYIHHYTSDENEAKTLISFGWLADNDGKPVFYSGGSVQINRLYMLVEKEVNEKTVQIGLHHHTADAYEYSVLPVHGWEQEGESFRAVALP